MLFLQRNDSTPFTVEIVNACLHNDVFDYTVNSDREQYLFDVVHACSNADDIRHQLIDALPRIGDIEDGWMLSALVRMFAEEGDQVARRALLASFERELADHPGLVEIVKLDGLQGLIFVADRLGDRGFAGPDHCDTDSMVETAIERFGSDAVWRELETASRTSSRIALFASLAQERQLRWASGRTGRRNAPSEVGFDDLRREIDKAVESEPYPSVFVNGWGRVASESDLLQAAHELLTTNAEDAKRLVFYLKVFHWRKFPLEHDAILRLTAHDDRRVQNWAISALEHVHHEDVRARGLDLTKSEDPWLRRRSLDLVDAFPQPGDQRLMESMLTKESDDEALHGIGQSMLDAAETTQSRDWVNALLALYELGPCAMCRSRVVDHLISLAALPEDIANECLFDADLTTRTAAQEYLTHAG